MKRFSFDKFDVALITVLVVAFGLIASLPFAPPRFGDEYFHQEAQWLAWFVQGAGPWKDVVITRAPAPDIYYTIPYLLVKPKSSENIYWLAATSWNAIWVMVATLLVRRTGQILAGPLAGKLAATLSLSAPFVVYYACQIGAETSTYLGATILAYGWARSFTGDFKRSSTIWLSLAGLALFVLSRPNVTLFAALLLPVSVGLWRKKTFLALREAKFALLCSVAAVGTLLGTSQLLTLLPKKLGTSQQQKNFADVMFFGSFQCRTELFDWRFWGKKTKTGSVDYANWSTEHDKLIEQTQNAEELLPKLELNWAIQDILHHPFIRIRMMLARLLMLNVAILNSTAPTTLVGRLLFIAGHVAVNIIGILPLVGALVFLFIFRGQLLSYWSLWAPWVTLLFFHAFVYSEPRYMLSSRPLLSIMAAMAIAKWLETKKSFGRPILIQQTSLATEMSTQRAS